MQKKISTNCFCIILFVTLIFNTQMSIVNKLHLSFLSLKKYSKIVPIGHGENALLVKNSLHYQISSCDPSISKKLHINIVSLKAEVSECDRGCKQELLHSFFTIQRILSTCNCSCNWNSLFSTPLILRLR